MKQPVPSDDYGHGQMMGMLVVIAMFENAAEKGIEIPQYTLDTIKRIASQDLSEYLDKPEEDVLLLVETQIKEKAQ
tara:strand:+ start:109 stop:336 length:228 start_codon:yes stop_codon:yes gene_type:complete